MSLALYCANANVRDNLTTNHAVVVISQKGRRLKLLTPQEVSDLLGLPLQTLASWRYFGKGPSYIKVGRLVRYQEEDVIQWIKDNTVATTAA